jgi:hypothetical protein
MELVTIACKLPHGLVLEGGYEFVPGQWGSLIKTDKYFKVTLNGWYAEHMKNFPRIQPIAELNPPPGLTQIPKEIWLAWLQGAGKHHPAVKNGLIFEMREDKASQKSQLKEMEQKAAPFLPLDPNKLPEGVEKADFSGDR